MLKETIKQRDITIISTYAHNMVDPKYIKYLLTDIKKNLQ